MQSEKTKLFIDDERYATSSDFIIKRTSKEAIQWMEENGCPDFISFDHDLGGDDTARKVVMWMIDKDLENPDFIKENFDFYVHSQNPIGAKWIKDTLEGYFSYKNKTFDEKQEKDKGKFNFTKKLNFK